MASWDDINYYAKNKDKIEKNLIRRQARKQYDKERGNSIYAKDFGLKASIIIMGSIIGLVGAGIYYLVEVVGV